MKKPHMAKYQQIPFPDSNNLFLHPIYGNLAQKNLIPENSRKLEKYTHYFDFRNPISRARSKWNREGDTVEAILHPKSSISWLSIHL